jgi:hypothetical protein
MEQQKLTNEIEYTSGTRVFRIRAQATRGDKYQMGASMTEGAEIGTDGKSIKANPGLLYPWLIQRFVISCNEISGNGQDILKRLMEEPADPNEDLILILGAFIFNHVTGLAAKPSDEGKKKE